MGLQSRVGIAIVFSLSILLSSQVVVGLQIEDDAAKNRPVSKVIALLKDMLKQLEKEATDDEEIYDKMACWCQTNDREKNKAISDAEVKIEQLTTRIEELVATGARLDVEVKNHVKEVAAHQDSLKKATAIRTKQMAEFNAEEKDLLESVSALKAAVTVLSKHHGGNLLQTPRAHVLGVLASLQNEMKKHSVLLQSVLTPRERRKIATFVQSTQDYVDSQPTFKQSYAPQSGEIFGILKEMQESFEANLSDSQKEELVNQKAYQELKSAKEEEIAAGQAQIDSKSAELADTDEKQAQAKQDAKDTRATLSADEQFLMNLKETCQMTDKEWEERQKTRQLEMQAVSQAVAVLSSDDARDLVTRTFNPAFFQIGNSNSRQTAASRVIRAAAAKALNPRLATLAIQVKLDGFERVKKAIDDMVVQLLKEKEDESKHKDFCVDEFNMNEQQTEKKVREKKDLDAKMEDLNLSVKQLTEEVEAHTAEIAEMQVQLKRAGEDRENQNKEFQTTIADQRETQEMLKRAHGMLADFYRKAKTAPALAQKAEPAGPPPPEGFKSYKNNAASGGVLSLLEQIINDAKAMETEAIRSEEDAQKAYEDFVKETNRVVEAGNKAIVGRSQLKAQREVEQVETKESKESAVLELEQLSNYNAQLHQSCDFVLKNFDLRQTARDEEVEALRQAKAILSGASFD